MKRCRNYVLGIVSPVLLLGVVGCVSDVERGVMMEEERLREKLYSLADAKREYTVMIEAREREIEACQEKIMANADRITAMRERGTAFWKYRPDVMRSAGSLVAPGGLNRQALVRLGDAGIVPAVKESEDGGEQLPRPYATMPLLKLPQQEKFCVIVDTGFEPLKEEIELGAFEILLEGDDVDVIALAILDENNILIDYKTCGLSGKDKDIHVSQEVVDENRGWKRVYVSFEKKYGFVNFPRKYRWGLIVPKHAKIPCSYLGVFADSFAKNLGMNIQVAPFKDKNVRHEFTTPKAVFNEANYPTAEVLSDNHWEKQKEKLNDRQLGQLAKDQREIRNRKESSLEIHKREVADKVREIESSLRPSIGMAVYGVTVSNK